MPPKIQKETIIELKQTTLETQTSEIETKTSYQIIQSKPTEKGQIQEKPKKTVKFEPEPQESEEKREAAAVPKSSMDKFGMPSGTFQNEVEDLRTAPLPPDCNMAKFIDDIKFVQRLSYNQKKQSA